MEKEKASHSSILAWESPGTEEPWIRKDLVSKPTTTSNAWLYIFPHQILHVYTGSSTIFLEQFLRAVSWAVVFIKTLNGLPWWFSCKESTCQCRICRFNPWVGKITWGRNRQPTPVLLPGQYCHGQRSHGVARVEHDLETKQPWIKLYLTHTHKNIMHQLPQLELVQGFVLFKTSDQSLHDWSSAFANASSGKLQDMVETGKCMATGVRQLWARMPHIYVFFFSSELVNSPKLWLSHL